MKLETICGCQGVLLDHKGLTAKDADSSKAPDSSMVGMPQPEAGKSTDERLCVASGFGSKSKN